MLPRTPKTKDHPSSIAALSQTGRISALGAVLLLALVGSGLGMLFMSLQGDGQPALQGLEATVLNPPRPLRSFELLDHHKHPFNRGSLEGKWSLLFFGYTHCPDICPSTMTILHLVDRRLSQRPDYHQDTQVAFVSVDPERDSVEQLAKYVPYFNASFLGVTESQPGNLKALTRQLGVVYERLSETRPGIGYLVDHSASIILVDPQARYHALFTAPYDPESIARDFVRIRKRYEEQS